MFKLCCIKLALAVFLNDFLMRASESAFDSFKKLKRFVSHFLFFRKSKRKIRVEALPFSTANEIPLKVSGNLNGIQSSVNITDFRLSFHKKNSLHYLHV